MFVFVLRTVTPPQPPRSIPYKPRCRNWRRRDEQGWRRNSEHIWGWDKANNISRSGPSVMEVQHSKLIRFPSRVLPLNSVSPNHVSIRPTAHHPPPRDYGRLFRTDMKSEGMMRRQRQRGSEALFSSILISFRIKSCGLWHTEKNDSFICLNLSNQSGTFRTLAVKEGELQHSWMKLWNKDLISLTEFSYTYCIYWYYGVLTYNAKLLYKYSLFNDNFQGLASVGLIP